MGLKDALINKGPQLAMMAMAARQGGPQALAALMQGIQQKEMLAQQQSRQQQGDARAEELHQANLGNIKADNDRHQQAAEMDKLNKALALIQQATAGQENATDPVQAENNIMRQAQSAAGLYGLEPDKLTGMVPNMAPVITGRQKKQAGEIYAQAVKVYGQEAVANDAITLTGTVFGDVKPSKLLALSQGGAVDAAGAPAKPFIEPPNQGVPTTERLALAAFAKEKGVTPDALSSQDLLAFNKSFRQSDDRATVADPNGLKPMQEFSISERLAKSWGDATKSKREMTRQLSLMDAGLKRYRAGDTNGGSQAVLVTFQKILDPTSVVRESEYARTTAGQSLMNRMEGYITRLENGGTTLTDPELAAMVETARTFLSEMDAHSAGQRRRIDAQVKKYQIDPATVFDDVLLGTDAAPAPAGGPKKYEIIGVK